MGKIYTLKCDSTKFQKSRFQVFTPFCDSSCNQLFCKSFAEGRDVLNSHQQHNKHQNANVLYKKFSGDFFPQEHPLTQRFQRRPPATAAHKVPLRRTFAVVSGHPCGLWGMRMQHLTDGDWEVCTGSQVFLGFRTSSCSQKKNDVFFVGYEKNRPACSISLLILNHLF